MLVFEWQFYFLPQLCLGASGPESSAIYKRALLVSNSQKSGLSPVKDLTKVTILGGGVMAKT